MFQFFFTSDPTRVRNKVFSRTQLGSFWTLALYTTGVHLEQWPHRQRLTQYGQAVRTSQCATLISVPCAQYLSRSNSNTFEINSAKRKFAYLATEHIRDLVSNQWSPVTVCTFKCVLILIFWKCFASTGYNCVLFFVFSFVWFALVYQPPVKILAIFTRSALSCANIVKKLLMNLQLTLVT
jgi:hypothetical protein